MANKQKHDLGFRKRKLNLLLNPPKLGRELKNAPRTSDHSRDYITAIDIDRMNGLKY